MSSNAFESFEKISWKILSKSYSWALNYSWLARTFDTNPFVMIFEFQLSQSISLHQSKRTFVVSATCLL